VIGKETKPAFSVVSLGKAAAAARPATSSNLEIIANVASVLLWRALARMEVLSAANPR
jgi:hypothetical protein